MTEKENKINNLITAIVGKVASLISTHNSDTNSHSDIRNAINNISTSGPVTVEKQNEAETGYVATYVIKQNGNQVGSKINIPKDFLVKSGTVETCVFLNQPVGCNVGDKYIDLVINTKANPETDEHIYIKVTDLIDTYEGDDAGTITITDNKIGLSTSIKNTINGKVNTSQGSTNANKNVVTDPSGNITTEAKPIIPTKTSQLTNDSNYTTATGHNHDSAYVKLSGGQTMTGNILIPSNADSSGNDATGHIPFAHTIQDTTKTVREILPTKKSFIGGVIGKKMDGTTGNQYDYVISARHRNGGGDGYKYGMYIRVPWSTNSNLLWAESNGGDYGAEKTILDSNNYSTYANKTTVDTALSSTSTNPVQNKVINTALSGKAASSHTHTKSQITDFPTSMTPTSHSHGSIANGGTLNSDITSVNKVAVTDSSNNLKTISKVPFANLNITKANITGLGIPGSDTNTTYTAASATPKINFYLGGVGTSAKYAREDHVHPEFDFNCTGSTSVAGQYVKLVQIKVTATYQDIPIEFEIFNRSQQQTTYCCVRFANANSTDPALDSITHYGADNKLWLYKESASTWSLIIQDVGTYQNYFVKVKHVQHTITELDTKISALPSSTSSNPLTQSTFIGYTSAEKTKLAGIATGANKYTHPAYTAKSSGLYKITVDATGHVSATTAVAKADITDLGIPASDTNTTYSAGTGLSLSGTTFSAKIANNLTTTATGSSLDATQGKALNDKVTAITSLNKSVQTITSFSNSYSGTLKWMIKNGWMFMTFENLKCTSTNPGFVAISSFSYAPETNNMVYWNFYPNTDNAVSVRVTNSGSIQARCFVANTVANGHMSFPCKLL